jgi:LacI family transcriptional regulator
MISSIELAKLCGVSQGTVDRALHNRPGISETTRRKILDLAKRHGYLPNPAVREIMDRSSNIVGAIIPALNNIFFMDMMSLLKDSLEAHGKMLFLTPVHGKADFLTALEEFAARKMHAAIVVPPEENLPLPSHLTQSLPVLSLLSRCSERSVPCLTADEIQTGKTAVQYLADLGHQKILHLTYRRKAKGIEDRTAGYKSQMNKLHLKPIVSIYSSENDFLKTLDRHHPTAIFCHNDWLAITILRHLQTHNIQIPQDISILGVDHTPTFQTLCPDLSSMEYPLASFTHTITDWTLTKKLTSPPEPLTVIPGKTVRALS